MKGPPPFDLLTSRCGERAVIAIVGELDVETAPRLRDEILGLTTQGVIHLRLDLAEMTFIDSTGIAVIVSALKSVRSSSGDIELRSPRPSTMKVLDMLGLTAVISIVEA